MIFLDLNLKISLLTSTVNQEYILAHMFQTSREQSTNLNTESNIESNIESNTVKIFDTWNNRFFTIPNGKSLKIYICGPTVYTHTHVGHLKTYMTFDILRRVLEDYFRFPIRFMMNITNVDDKIIKGTYQKEYGFSDNFMLKDLDEKQFLENQKFVDYADEWEKNFFDVMDSMNIRRPNVVSRVTEYIQEILDFVNKIDEKGFAFEDKGSVYFYGTKYNNIRDDKGLFSKDPENEHNFVLLKKTRPYEPGWKSGWKSHDNPSGSVRPGWHIECSAMASSIFGSNFDIHAGGIDLKFPHHHNEMQQSNSIFKTTPDDTEWVDHFMHTGHLNIEGAKMSRSLKNFITVAEIAKEYTPNQLRMLFLLHSWSAPMDYSEKTMSGAKFFLEYFENFFLQGKSILLRKTTKRHKKFGLNEMKYANTFDTTQLTVDSFLRNNIDTSSVIKSLHELGGSMFTYVTTTETEDTNISEELIDNTLSFVKKILVLFGLTFDDKINGSNDEKLLGVISHIRSDLRTIAKDMATQIKPLDKNLAKSLPQSLYKLTDDIRDTILPSIGIHLTDK